VIIAIVAQLVATGVAAKALGIDRATLHRWWVAGLVTPAFVTAGGHARWDLDELRAQLSALRQSQQDS
jgi:predicted site-specific integrase-resolvase